MVTKGYRKGVYERVTKGIRGRNGWARCLCSLAEQAAEKVVGIEFVDDAAQAKLIRRGMPGSDEPKGTVFSYVSAE
jgi:hypothetical protein